ncbi:MAG: fibrobacter succinogenes major paralogous domain-containing protein [Bacteroidia bacterium]|nr:fibrobacter succinogenes major paralogous domain-containing protein [Bacteroidia bacterium]
MKCKLLIYLLIVIGIVIMLTNSCRKDDHSNPSYIVKDIDSNVYHTVTIGSQVWMIENLKVTKYNDGTAIPFVMDTSAWINLTTPGFCWYNNDAPTYKNTYGALYNWYAVNTGKLCPEGWHVPSDAEWTQLTNYLGGVNIAGGKLKEAGTAHWLSPNTGADNSSGFTALPGGFRGLSGMFYDLDYDCSLWSSTEIDPSNAWLRSLVYGNAQLWQVYDYKSTGNSVRCILDNSFQTIPSVTTLNISNISQTSAISGGKVNSDGGEAVTARGVCWNTTGNPEVSDSHSIDGTGTGNFTSNISGLTENTPFFLRAFATNSKGTAYGNQLSFTTLSPIMPCTIPTITDYDGNTYNTVQIGSQCWMKENMKTTHYSDGTALIDDTNAGDISGNFITKFWFVYNNTMSVKTTYGLLYTWAAIMNGANSSSSNPSGIQGICPTGWHIPSDAEFTQLINFLGSDSIAGGKLKEAGNTHWNDPNSGATNSSGFTALPCGGRYAGAVFGGLFTDGIWWSATESDASYSWERCVGYDHEQVHRLNYYKSTGFSVRCVRDN